LPAAAVRDSVLRDVGARPWDRDAIDQRLLRQTGDRTARVINDEKEGGGYAEMEETRQVFLPDEWDLQRMERHGAVAK
jgi:hypothetical protein